MKKKFELNCDLGEQIGNDALLMPYLDTCSIACGGHIGDEDAMSSTVELALENNVEIGAHPSFPDKENFGRKIIPIEKEKLIKSLIDQVAALEKVCQQFNTKISHIKLHGALYNLAASNWDYAALALQAFSGFAKIPLYTPWESVLYKLAKKSNVALKTEAFADRHYNEDSKLVARSNPNAVITDPHLASKQVRCINENHQVLAINQVSIPMRAETFCVHGDNPNALSILKALHKIKTNG